MNKRFAAARSCFSAIGVLVLVFLAPASAQEPQAPQPEKLAAPRPAAACPDTGDLRDLVRRVIENDIANDEKVRDYIYIERAETRHLDGTGKVKKTESRTLERMVLYGSPVERVLEHNDQPLSEKDKAKEEERIDKLVRERTNESDEQKRKRQEKYDKLRAEDRAWVNEIATAYDFALLGEEPVEGREAYVISGEPRADFRPRRKQARVLPKLRFQAWVDKAECQWVRADVEAIDTLTYGGIVARIRKGSRISLEQTRVNHEVWLPRHASIKLGARVMLLKNYNVEADVTYRDYRKFRADARVTGVVEPEPNK